jgi:hypothetical protein
MADKAKKKTKSKKDQTDEKGVLAALPSTRPERIGGRRGATAAKPARAKPKRAAAKRASRPAATRPKAAAPRTFEPTQAAEAAAGAESRPQPVRQGAPGIGTAGRRDEHSPESRRPSGTDLAGTAVRAAGEVAQLGLTIGGEVLKRVVRRLPL